MSWAVVPMVLLLEKKKKRRGTENVKKQSMSATKK